MPMTGTVDVANARVDLFVDYATEVGTQTVATVTRRVGSLNAPDEYVRGLFGSTLLGEQAYLSDHEAPLDAQLWYVAVSDTGTTLVAGPFTIPSQGFVWLKDPGRPWADLKLDLCETPSRSEAECPDLLTVVSDTFERTVSNGWGTADTGQAWTTGGGVASNFSVGSGLGQQLQSTVSSTRIATVPGTLADLDVLVDVGTSQTALTSALLGGPILRTPANTDMYGVMVEFNTSGTVSLSVRKRVAGVETVLSTASSGLLYTPGQMFRVRFRAQGSVLRARVWPAGTAEPEAWLLNVSDATFSAGARVGVRSFTAPGNTNVSPVLLFDNFLAEEFAPSSVDIAWVGFRDKVRAADAGLFPVLDAERPADVFARRKDITTAITFLSRSLGALQGIYELFTAGGPLLVQVPLEYGMAAPYGQRDRYYQPEDLTEAYLSVDQRKTYRMWSAPVTAVEAPIGEPQGTDTANWCALEETYPTMGAYASSGYTWAQAASGAAVTIDLPGLYGSGPYGSGPYGG